MILLCSERGRARKVFLEELTQVVHYSGRAEDVTVWEEFSSSMTNRTCGGFSSQIAPGPTPDLGSGQSKEAQRSFPANDFDAVIADQKMPDGEGLTPLGLRTLKTTRHCR